MVKAADDEAVCSDCGPPNSPASSNRHRHGGFTGIECFAARQQWVDAQAWARDGA